MAKIFFLLTPLSKIHRRMVYFPEGLPLRALIKLEDNLNGKQSKKMQAIGTFMFEAAILGLITACSEVNIAQSSRSLQRKECYSNILVKQI